MFPQDHMGTRAHAAAVARGREKSEKARKKKEMEKINQGDKRR